MNDLQALTDAFAELERRADAHVPRTEPRPHRPRLVPAAAAVIVAAGLVTGVALLAPGQDSGSPSPVQAGGHGSSQATTPPPTTTSRHSVITDDPQELANRLHAVLGDEVTFTVTDTGHATDGNGHSSGAAIVGTMTASGVTGGYDFQIIPAEPGGTAWCDDPDKAHCTVKRLPDGSSLAIGEEPLNGPKGAVTYQVNLIREDGTEFLMHVSNLRDPKGESEKLGARPPLNTDQMVEIVTSDRW